MDGQLFSQYAMPWLYIWFTFASTVNSENLFDLAIYTDMSFLKRLDVVETSVWNIKGFFFSRDLLLFFRNTKMVQIKNEKKTFFSKNKSKDFDKEKSRKKPLFFESKFFSFEKPLWTESNRELGTGASRFWTCFQRIYCKTFI